MSTGSAPFQIAISGVEPLVQFGLLKCEALGIAAYNEHNLQVPRRTRDPRWVFLGANTENAHSDKEIIQYDRRLTAIYPMMQAVAPQIINDPFKQIVDWRDVPIVPIALLINHARGKQELLPVRIESMRGYLIARFGENIDGMRTHIVNIHRLGDSPNLFDWEKLVAATSEIEKYQITEGKSLGMRK